MMSSSISSRQSSVSSTPRAASISSRKSPVVAQQQLQAQNASTDSNNIQSSPPPSMATQRDRESTVIISTPLTPVEEQKAESSCKILFSLQMVSYHDTILSYILPDETPYALLISNKHQFIFTDCAFISIKSVSAVSVNNTSSNSSSSSNTSAGLSSKSSSAIKSNSINNNQINNNNTTHKTTGLRKQQIKRYDYFENSISNVCLTTPNFTAPLADGILEFHIGLSPTISDKINIDIHKLEWPQMKLLYRTLITLQRCQQRFDTAFQLEKHVISSVSITCPDPTTTNGYIPPYIGTNENLKKNVEMIHFHHVANIVTSLTDMSLSRYKPVSYKTIWEESLNNSVNDTDGIIAKQSSSSSSSSSYVDDNDDREQQLYI